MTFKRGGSAVLEAIQFVHHGWKQMLMPNKLMLISLMERLINSPPLGIRLQKEGRGFWNCTHDSVAHRTSPPWLKLDEKYPCVYFKCIYQLFQKKKKTFLMCRSPGKRCLQSQSLILLPPSGFSKTICRCRCSSVGARLPSPSPGFAEGTACAAARELRQRTCDVERVLEFIASL